jgi:hypothetical protein
MRIRRAAHALVALGLLSAGAPLASPTARQASSPFEDVLEVDRGLLAAFGSHVPRFRLFLDDLSKQTDADLRARTKMAVRGKGALRGLLTGPRDHGIARHLANLLKEPQTGA